MFCRCSATPFQNKTRSLTTEGTQSQLEAPVRDENSTDESRATAPQLVDVEKGSTSVERRDEPSVPTDAAVEGSQFAIKTVAQCLGFFAQGGHALSVFAHRLPK